MTGFTSKKLMAADRDHGKSVWNQIIQDLIIPHVKLIDSAEVDKQTWHTVQLSYPAAEWVRTQNKQHWVQTLSSGRHQNWFDIHESLYTMLMLKWN